MFKHQGSMGPMVDRVRDVTRDTRYRDRDTRSHEYSQTYSEGSELYSQEDRLAGSTYQDTYEDSQYTATHSTYEDSQYTATHSSNVSE